jgi:hypothetical protein
MTKQVQIRRGTTVQHQSFTGAIGEVTYDTDKKTLIAHDGSTVGGIELSRQDFANVPAATFPGSMSISGINTLATGNEVTEWDVTVGLGDTHFIVDGNARITGILSIGQGTVTISQNTISATNLEIGSINSNSLLLEGGGSVQSSLQTELADNVAAGATVFPIKKLGNAVADGDPKSFFSLTGLFNRLEVVAIGTAIVSEPFDKEYISDEIINDTVSIGATTVKIAETDFQKVAIGDSITAEPGLITEPIVGVTSFVKSYVDIEVLTGNVSGDAGTGSFIVPLNTATNVAVGDSFSTADVNYVADGRVQTIRIVGLGTTGVNPVLNGIFQTPNTQAVSAGSSVITVTGLNTSPTPIVGGVGQVISLVSNDQNATIYVNLAEILDVTGDNITIASTQAPAQNVPAESIASFSEYLFTTSDAATLDSPLPTAVLLGDPYVITRPLNSFGTEIEVAPGAITAGIQTGTVVSISSVSTTADTLIISNTFAPISSSVIGTGVTIENILEDQSRISLKWADTKNLNVSGIATINNLTYPFVDGLKGQVLQTDGQGNIGFGTGYAGGSDAVYIVSSANGDDLNDGRTLPVKSIKRAAQLASLAGKQATILVQTGEYIEDNPIIVYDNVSIIGDSLRNIVVRPLNSGLDLFWVRNGCYLTGMTFNDFVDPITLVPQHTWNYSVAFDDPYYPNFDRTGYACTDLKLITNATYDGATGFTTITTSTPHELYRATTARITGLGWTCGYDEAGISSVVYDNVTGITTLTLRDSPTSDYFIGSKLFLDNLQFACTEEHAGVTTTVFPYAGLGTFGAVYEITGVDTGAKTITIQGGITTIPHTYVGWKHVGIQTFSYDNASGVCTVTTVEPHRYFANDNITLWDLPFSCSAEHAGVTTTIFPDGSKVGDLTYTFKVGQVIDEYTYTTTVGASTIPHTYDGYGGGNVTAFTYDNASGVSTATMDANHGLTAGDYVTLDGLVFSCSGYSTSQYNVVAASYNEVAGIATIILNGNHGLTPGKSITLQGLEFSCTEEHAGITSTIFPYAGSSPNTLYGTFDTYEVIEGTEGDKLVINAGVSTIPHTYVSGGTATLGITTTVFPDIHSGPNLKTFEVTSVISPTEFVFNSGISTITHTYVSGGTAQKVPTAQKVGTAQRVRYYPDEHKSQIIDFGVVTKLNDLQFIIRGEKTDIQHYFADGGTVRLTRPLINKSPYIQNCSILSSLGGNGISVDGARVLDRNVPLVPQLGEIPVVGAQPEFGKSMVAATFTMISFDGIGWRTINDGYAQVVSCFQIFCRFGSLSQSGGYLSITNSATNFGNIALRATGFSPNAFLFDRGRVAATGTSGGLQTLKVVGAGRSDQELYVLRFLDDNFADQTNLFKPLVQSATFNPSTSIDVDTEVITIPAHPFQEGDSVVYLGNELAVPQIVIDGLVSGNQYYVEYIDSSSFRLFEDESKQRPVDLGSAPSGINTFTKNNQEFIVDEIINSHTFYQTLTFDVGIASTAHFNSGQQLTQSVQSGVAVGYALTYKQETRELIVSVEEIGGSRYFFGPTGGSNGFVQDHTDPNPLTVGVSTVVGLSTYVTLDFKVQSTSVGNVIANIGNLPVSYRCHFHRPSIVNSSAHTWEYSGSGTDYNALPQNGGRGDLTTEQVSELGGRVYASGTNELGDFKIGDQITAFNRTGNIVFNNKVSIGELDTLRLSLSSGVTVEEFSTSTQLGDDEIGGPQNFRVPTQLAVRSFLANRLGTFIDKVVSSNAVPNAVVQLNAAGQINSDLIPPQIASFIKTNVGGGKTVLVNRIPATDVTQGTTVVEPQNSYVLVNDSLSQYLVLDSKTADYAFNPGDAVVSTLTKTSVGIVTAPPQNIGIGTTVAPYVGYGSTGLVKGVAQTAEVSNVGSGYLTPGIYEAVPTARVTGIGTDILLTVEVSPSGTILNTNLVTGGKGYQTGDVISFDATDVGGRSGGADGQVTITDVETRLYLDLTGDTKFVGTSDLPDYIADGNAVGITTDLGANYIVEFDPTDVGTGGDIDFTNSRLVIGANDFSDGDPIKYDAGTGSPVSGLLDDQVYYVKRVGITSIELHPSYALSSKVLITGSGIGTHTVSRHTIVDSKDTIVFKNHGFTTGDPFRITGAAPSGITTGNFYFAGSVTINSFTLHDSQSDATQSANGTTFNPIGFGSATGIAQFTKQNVRYRKTVNTSSQYEDNYSLLAQQDIDAANIISGIINPSRLGTGNANSDTILTGTSEYRKSVFSVGIGTTQPIGATGSSVEFAPNGVGINTYYGNVNLTLNRVKQSLDLYSSLGVSRFKTSTFEIGDDGEVSIKNSNFGDVDAATLGGQNSAYYLDSANHTGTIPITRGGTNLSSVPASGAILIGNGTAYDLTTTPIFRGNVTVQATLNATTLEDSIGNVRDVPNNNQGGNYTLVAQDAGRCINISSGSVFVPANTMGVGDAVSVFNNRAGTMTIVQNGGVTLRFAGTGNTGNRTLAQYGLCTILCVGTNTFVVTGGGLS